MKFRHLLFPALLLGALSPLTVAPSAHAFVDVSIDVAPPPLVVYEQPPCPVEGYLWTPGYWDYADAGYYWVPGVWVEPPRVGFLWTPGYWGYADDVYVFHRGYWGPTVGFYGGVDYGYGYGGYGYGGGRWEGDRFRYNTAITRVNTTVIHNTYIDKTVIRNGPGNRTSFNGPGGINARPDARQLAAARGEHLAPTGDQVSHRQTAAQERRDFHPAAAANRPAEERHAANPQPFNDRAAEERQAQAERRENRNGLSADEQRLVDHREQARDAARVPTDPRFESAGREAKAERQAAKQETRQRQDPYANRSFNDARRAPADPRSASAGREAKAERQAAKQETRQRQEGGGREGDKHDKHDRQGF